MSGVAMPEAAEKNIPIQEDGVYIWEKNYPEGLDWRMEFDNRTLCEVLEDTAQKFGGRPAIDFYGREFTYTQLVGMVQKIAAGLQKMGVKKDIKVGLFLPNTPYSVMFYYGTLKAGGVAVNYNPLYAEHDLINQIEDSETDIFVTVDNEMILGKAMDMLEKTRLKNIIVCPTSETPIELSDDRCVHFHEVMSNDGTMEDVVLNPKEDVAVLQYTGGTTGVPKGAMLTHENLSVNTAQAAAWLKNMEPGVDSQLAVLPFFHVFAMTVLMNVSIWNGLKIIILPKFDLKEVLNVIQDKKPSHFPAVPAIFNAIGSYANIANYNFSALKFCLSGGAPLPGDVKRLFEEKTGSQRVGEGYGLTETSPVATCNPVEGIMKVGSVGVPVPGTIIDIIDPEDGKTLLPVGVRGEICISGPQVMKGYYNKPEETAEAIRNGRLHTGDIGYIDEDGFIFIVDRIKDLILVSGFNVYPRHVEEAIYTHPSVEECIVAGVPDQSRGEAVWAWVKPIEGATLEAMELKKFLRDKIGPAEQPRKIIIKQEPLPKTAVGKLSRKDLLEQEGITK